MDAMIEVKNLRKHFGAFIAVSDISFSVQRGEVLGFLGPNGAGKSTAMKMITGFLAPTSGHVKVCGHDVEQEPLAVKKSIGYLPEGAPVYGDMTPKAFLEFAAEMRGLSGAQKQQRIDEAVDKTNLKSVLHKPVETLSKGFKRRVGLAQAILHDPDVLILDEPTDGLDPNQKHEVRELLKAMAKDKAIIISTHILEEVDAVCTRAIIIAQGKLLFDGTPKDLEAMAPARNTVSLLVETGDPNSIRKQLQGLSGIKRVDVSAQNDKQRFLAVPDKGQPVMHEIAELSRKEKWSVDEMHVEPVRLDDVFRLVTTKGGSAEEALS
jgi:ABC-2 type transport system ATP-binding protein